MNEQNNLPKGVITNQTINDSKTNNVVSTKKKVPKFNKKIVIIVVVLLIAFFVIGNLITTGKVGKLLGNNAEDGEYQFIEVDLDTKWGTKYATAAQYIYKDEEVDTFDLAFINVDDSGDPEMLIKYVKNEKEFLTLFYIDALMDQGEGRVIQSKSFSPAEVKILYSLTDGESNFYLNIVKDSKYGTYTLFSKVIAGTVNKPDISSLNDTEKKTFEEKYIVANYSPVFYQVSKDNYKENFTTMYDRYEKYSDEIKEVKEKLDDEYGDAVKKEENEEEYLVTGNYYLTFGDYNFVPYTDESGQVVESKYTNVKVTLNRDGTITIDGTTYKYDLTSNMLKLDNGISIEVTANNIMLINDDGGAKYEAANPYERSEEDETTE